MLPSRKLKTAKQASDRTSLPLLRTPVPTLLAIRHPNASGHQSTFSKLARQRHMGPFSCLGAIFSPSTSNIFKFRSSTPRIPPWTRSWPCHRLPRSSYPASPTCCSPICFSSSTDHHEIFLPRSGEGESLSAVAGHVHDDQNASETQLPRIPLQPGGLCIVLQKQAKLTFTNLRGPRVIVCITTVIITCRLWRAKYK